MVPADDANSRIADYLARLEAALEVLGPSEAADTTAEIGSYLAQADADDRLDSQLETLGAPESFAAGILAERGLLPTAAPTERAPRVRRTLAALIDAVVAVMPLVLLFPLVVGVPLFVATGGEFRWRLPLLLVAALLLGVTVAWAIRYWRNRSRGGGRASRPWKQAAQDRSLPPSSEDGGNRSERSGLGSERRAAWRSVGPMAR